MDEINFIDGQQLTPSSFGETNAATGAWQPVRYTGTYGTNGFYLPFTNNAGVTATTMGQDNSTYRMLTAQLNGTSNGIQRGADLTGIANGKSGTISMWWNFTGASSGNQALWISRNNLTIGNTFHIYRVANGNLSIAAANSAGTNILSAATTTTPCAAAGVYHIYVTWDLAVSNRISVYVNGASVNLNITTFTNDTIAYSQPNHGIGGDLFNPFSPTTPGMVGQVYINYATYLDPVTNIGKFYGGVNTPVSLGAAGATPSGSSPIVYLDGDATSILTNRGTGGNFVAFGTLATGTTYQGSSAVSGIYFNNWTPTNMSVTAGATYDSLTDVPTLTSATAANFATLNPLAPNSGTITNANFRFSTGAAYAYGSGTITIPSTGKWIFEVVFNTNTTNNNYNSCGVVTAAFNRTAPFNGTGGYGVNDASSSFGQSFVQNGVRQGSITLPAGTVIQCLIDRDAGTLTFTRNGVLQTGTGSTVTLPAASVELFAVVGEYNINADVNFGQQPFTYAAPAGFLPLNTFNLPTPVIGASASTLAGAYMSATLYTGTGTNQTINTGFTPGIWWIKSRSAATNNRLYNEVATGQYLVSNNTANAVTSGTVAQTSNGFIVGTDTDVNNNAATYVAWSWLTGGAGVTNTAGTITSTVSASTISGCSVVTWTGNGTAGATVGHGLGIVPSMIIVQTRTGTNNKDKPVYHSSLGNTKAIGLNSTAAETTATGFWNNTTPGSSVFTLGNDQNTNQNTSTYLAYCFAQIAGYSAFGSYTGNGNANGPFVYTGFRPKFVMWKRTDTTGSWFMVDSTRNTYNVANLWLQANTADAEQTDAAVDYLSNGFKQRTATGTGSNANGGTYIYAAFAETPFKYALAR